MNHFDSWNSHWQKVWDWISGVSIRTKILGIVLGLVLLLGGSITLQVRAILLDVAIQQLQEQSVSLARDLAARSTDPLLINDWYDVLELLRETQANNPDVRYVFILNPQGDIVAHTFVGGFPTDLATVNPVASSAHHHTLALATEEGVLWDTAVPIFAGKAGVARVGLSEQRTRAMVNLVTAQLLFLTVLVSIVGIAAASFLTWLLTRPIRRLVQAANAVRQGDYTPRVRRWANDELGELADAFNAMTEGLAVARAERQERERMRAYYLKQIISAQEEERKRIARELHDETGQVLTSLLVRLKVAAETAAPQEHLAELREIAAQALAGVRDLARELRPSLLDDLGLVAALERYLASCGSKFGLSTDFQTTGFDDDQRLPPEVEVALYRIVQEALTNVVKHAQARTVSVVLERKDGAVIALVEDDGVGFQVASTRLHLGSPETWSVEQAGLGLYGMEERAALLGGTLTLESSPGQGTTVRVEIPL